IAGEHSGQVPFFLRLGADGDDGRPDQAESDRAEQLRCVGKCQFFLENGLLDERRAPTAVLHWPRDARIAGIEKFALPVCQILVISGRRLAGPDRMAGLFGEVGLKPRAQVIAEFEFTGSETEVHLLLAFCARCAFETVASSVLAVASSFDPPQADL